MTDNERTHAGFTETSDGPIDHKLHASGILCPVVLLTEMRTEARTGRYIGEVVRKNSRGLPIPEIADSGGYVYALPGGERWAE